MNTLYVCVLLALAVFPILATTQQNVTTTKYNSSYFGAVTIASEPVGRGTFGIILSGTATFGFCVWRAVHPDIMPAVSSTYRVFYKFIWMFVTILLPEAIIICAYGQLQEAKEVYKEWEKNIKPAGTEGNWEDDFGMKGAFLVVMGGFIVDEFELEEKRVEPKCLPLFKQKSDTTDIPYTSTLTSTGFKKYLERGYIDKDTFGLAFAADGSAIPHSIGLRALADKGNSSVAAKSIAFVQIIWFLVQCISRGVYGLPLTLLEVHVAIQVLSTIIIWVCWFDKPSEVNEPILIRLRIPPVEKMLETDKDTQPQSVQDPPPKSPPQDLEIKSEIDKEAQPSLLLPPPKQPLQSLEKTSEVDKETQISLVSPHPSEPFCRDINAREDRVRTSKKYTVLGEDNKKVPHDVITKSSPPRVTAIAAKALYDISKHIDTGENKRLVVLVEATLVSIIGVLHAAVWNLHFPTTVERVIWRVTSLGMCLFPLAVALIMSYTEYQRQIVKALWGAQFLESGIFNITYYAFKRIYKVWNKGVRGKGSVWENDSTISRVFRGLAHCVMMGFCSLCAAAYAFSITFITVESYISLRDPPVGAFLTAKWNAYWPHL